MSWDVVVMNFNGNPLASVEEMSDDVMNEPLGGQAVVREAVSKHLPGVDWGEPSFGVYE